MGKHRKPGEGSYRRTYTARVRVGGGSSRAVRIYRPVGETRAPRKRALLAAFLNKADGTPRLAPGESLDTATIRQSWEGRLRLPDGQRAVVYGATRAEAAEKLKAAVRAAKSGVTAGSARLTVGSFLAEWLDGLDVRPRTWEAYESHVRVHLAPSLGRLKLANLTASDVDRMLAAKLQAGLAPSTVNRIRATLRVAIGQALKRRLVATNVVTFTPSRKEEPQPPNLLTAEQASSFLAATAGDRLHALWALALGTGVRQGEALGLTWRHVDLDAGTTTIRYTLQPKRGSKYSSRIVPPALYVARLAPPKSKRSFRTLNLPAFVVAALRAHRAAQRGEKLASGPAWAEGDYVFTKPDGRPLDGPWVTKRLQGALADAGLPRQRFHDLRHAAATLLLAQGADLRVIMEVLGHSSITLTANTYAHVGRAALKDAAAKLQDALG